MAEDSLTSTPSEEEQHGWLFAGWGNADKITDLGHEPVEMHSLGAPEQHKLGQWRATAICGNDITSSVLYVSAFSIAAAGRYAPFALLIVAGVLFLFRKIYAEVGSALPLNGGTYTLLLNTTNKKLAAAAACLTLLSYIATAVISAGEAMHYAEHLVPSLDVFWATIGLLGFFAFLNLMGITESAVVALAIFVFHMVTMVVLGIAAAVAVAQSPEVLVSNWSAPLPSGRGFLEALFFGFAAAMLGISGFESSANFIEEQKRGVFPKTLRNMWIAVSILNPIMCFLALGLIPTSSVTHETTNLLSQMGMRCGGSWLATWVSIDAVLVLSGAVLTSYVGVTGLVRRMSLDRCMPQRLLRQNKLRHTNHWIIIGFFLLCVSILAIAAGPKVEVNVLAGVYTISFLGVMALYALGNMLLKVARSRLPRDVRASWPAALIALVAVVVGLIGNLTIDNLTVFGTYLVAVGLGVAVMFLRVELMRALLFVSQSILDKMTKANAWVRRVVVEKVQQFKDTPIIYFTRGDNLSTLNRAALYVLENEQTHRLMVVHVYQDESEIPKPLAEHLKIVDRLYPQLRIDFIAVEGKFGPELIERLSDRLKVPKNYMFIGTPGDRFPHNLADLGGVRLIL